TSHTTQTASSTVVSEVHRITSDDSSQEFGHDVELRIDIYRASELPEVLRSVKDAYHWVLGNADLVTLADVEPIASRTVSAHLRNRTPTHLPRRSDTTAPRPPFALGPATFAQRPDQPGALSRALAPRLRVLSLKGLGEVVGLIPATLLRRPP